jgi:hypothetical protein
LLKEEQDALSVEQDEIHGKRSSEDDDGNTLRPGADSGRLVRGPGGRKKGIDW